MHCNSFRIQTVSSLIFFYAGIIGERVSLPKKSKGSITVQLLLTHTALLNVNYELLKTNLYITDTFLQRKFIFKSKF